MIIPNRLHQGDAIGVIAPAGPPNMLQLGRGIDALTSLGLRVQLGAHIANVYGYLAGTDDERTADLHHMFQDPTIKAVFCACGGYGSARIAHKIDYQLIERNPKIFVGYSDITYLHTAIRQQANLVTFHGPMVSSDIGRKHFDSLSKKMLYQLFKPIKLQYSESISPLEVLSDGIATGELTGGNLSILTSTLATPYEVDTKGKILLIEDIGEEPYRIDRMLNQLRLAGKFDHLAGIIVGSFTEAAPSTTKPSFQLDQVLATYFQHLSVPIIKGFNIGHCLPNITIPLGAKATLNSYNKTLEITPSVE